MVGVLRPGSCGVNIMVDCALMESETNIFLVRHGETEWNKQNRLQGNLDSPLSRKGIRQAHEAKKSLERYVIDKAYVSPLKRARDTMDIILEDRELEAVTIDNLREINLGPWEGKTRAETMQSHPDEYLAFWENPDSFYLPGADTFHALQQRVVKALESIFLKEKNKNVIVVSHWIAIKVAITYYSSIPISNLSDIADPDNGSFLLLSRRDKEVFIF